MILVLPVQLMRPGIACVVYIYIYIYIYIYMYYIYTIYIHVGDFQTFLY